MYLDASREIFTFLCSRNGEPRARTFDSPFRNRGNELSTRNESLPTTVHRRHITSAFLSARLAGGGEK